MSSSVTTGVARGGVALAFAAGFAMAFGAAACAGGGALAIGGGESGASVIAGGGDGSRGFWASRSVASAVVGLVIDAACA